VGAAHSPDGGRDRLTKAGNLRLARFIQQTLLLAPLVALAGAAQAADPADRLTIVRCAKVITGAGQEIENGVVVISGGKIENVGKDLEYPLNVKVIDARKYVAMPGLVHGGTRYSLPNYQRRGVNTHRTVADEWMPDAANFEPLLKLGFTTLNVLPPGEGLPGRSMIVRTAGPADARILQRTGPQYALLEKKELRDALKKAETETEKVRKAREQFEQQQKQAAAKAATASQPASQPADAPASQPASAPASQPAFQPPPTDPAFEALSTWLEKKSEPTFVIRILKASDYAQMLDLLQERELSGVRWSLQNFTRTDFHYVIERMGTAKEKLFVRPWRAFLADTSERIYLPVEFARAGAEVALIPTADTHRAHELYLQQVSELVAVGGWSREDAYRALTQTPAKLLGIDDQVGAIEKDKSADLALFDADPLSPGAKVKMVIIAGEVVYRAEDVK
jgi:hypothetical protein